MRRTGWTVAMLLSAGLALPVGAAELAASSWDRVKSLAGTWEGTFEGKPARVTYALVSNGTALMETLDPRRMSFEVVDLAESRGWAWDARDGRVTEFRLARPKKK